MDFIQDNQAIVWMVGICMFLVVVAIFLLRPVLMWLNKSLGGTPAPDHCSVCQVPFGRRTWYKWTVDATDRPPGTKIDLYLCSSCNQQMRRKVSKEAFKHIDKLVRVEVSGPKTPPAE